MRPTLLLLALSSSAAAWSWPWSSFSSSSTSSSSCSKQCLNEHLNKLQTEELRCGDVTNDFCCRIVHVLSTTKESEWAACTEKCGVSLVDLFHDSLTYCHANMFTSEKGVDEEDEHLELRSLHMHTLSRRSTGAAGIVIIVLAVVVVISVGSCLCLWDSNRRKKKRLAGEQTAATLDAALDNVQDRYTGFQGRGNHPSNQPIKMSGPWPEELEPKPAAEPTGGIRGFYEGAASARPAVQLPTQTQQATDGGARGFYEEGGGQAAPTVQKARYA